MHRVQERAGSGDGKDADAEPFELTYELSREGDKGFLFLGVQGRHVPLKRQNIVLLIDTSGSMCEKKQQIRMTLATVFAKLNEGDKISVVTYSNVDHLFVNGLKKSKEHDIKYLLHALDKMEISGCTYGSKGIGTAYDIAAENYIEDGINRVIMVTDGDLNFGITEKGELSELISAKKQSGVYYSAIGTGLYNLMDDKLQALARNGNGNYFVINSIKDAEHILRDRYEAQMEKYQFQNGIAEVFKVISRANKYIDETTPWVLAKDPSKRPRLARVMYNLLETIRIGGALLAPVMPETSEKIMGRIGAAEYGWDSLNTFGVLPAAAAVTGGEALFPRIDVAKELAALAELTAPAPEEPAAEPVTFKPEIAFGDFEKVDMTVVKVLACENVKKSKKLLRFELDDGSGETRQILSGIAQYYTAEELVGKTLVACTNLAPRKMMGLESCGMLLSAERDGALHLLMLDDAIPAGAKLC